MIHANPSLSPFRSFFNIQDATLAATTTTTPLLVTNAQRRRSSSRASETRSGRPDRRSLSQNEASKHYTDRSTEEEPISHSSSGSSHHTASDDGDNDDDTTTAHRRDSARRSFEAQAAFDAVTVPRDAATSKTCLSFDVHLVASLTAEVQVEPGSPSLIASSSRSLPSSSRDVEVLSCDGQSHSLRNETCPLQFSSPRAVSLDCRQNTFYHPIKSPADARLLPGFPIPISSIPSSCTPSSSIPSFSIPSSSFIPTLDLHLLDSHSHSHYSAEDHPDSPSVVVRQCPVMDYSSNDKGDGARVESCSFPNCAVPVKEGPQLSYRSNNNHQQQQQDHQPRIVFWSVVLLGFLNIFLDTALSASVIPILPRELKQDEFHEAIIIGCGAVTATLFGPICGLLSDDCGWQFVLMWFYPLVFTSAVLMLSARHSFVRFLVARLIAGAGSGFMYPSNLTMVVATHPISNRASAVGFTLAGDIGSLLSPIVSGYLYDLGGLNLVFSILLCVTVVASLVFVLVLPSVSSTASLFECCLRVWNVQLATPSSHADQLRPLTRTEELAQPFLVPAATTATPAAPTAIPPPPTSFLSISLSPPSSLVLGSVTPDSQHRALQHSVHPSHAPGPSPNKTPSIVSTRDPESDGSHSVCLARSPPSRGPHVSSFDLPVFAHGSPPPPYLYNLHFQRSPPVLHQVRSAVATSVSIPSYSPPPSLEAPAVPVRGWWYAEWSSTVEKLKVFSTISFLSRCTALFYCWGLALSLQSILPLIWDRNFNIGPTRIGILFAPHLILRVAVSAFFPFFSDITATPLRTLISYGLLICTVATAILSLLPTTVSPVVHSVVVGLVGMGLGLTDSCAIAWGGAAIFTRTPSSASSASVSPLASPIRAVSNTTTSFQPDSLIDTSSESYRGRAFALLALACDVGMFTIPLFASFLCEYLSFSVAFGVLSFGGLLVFGMSLYCGWIEAKAEDEREKVQITRNDVIRQGTGSDGFACPTRSFKTRRLNV